MNAPEFRLRNEYISGRIEVDEFEQRIEAILRDEPLAVDALDKHSPFPGDDRPGSILYYRPIDGTPQWADPPRPVNLTD